MHVLNLPFFNSRVSCSYSIIYLIMCYMCIFIGPGNFSFGSQNSEVQPLCCKETPAAPWRSLLRPLTQLLADSHCQLSRNICEPFGSGYLSLRQTAQLMPCEAEMSHPTEPCPNCRFINKTKYWHHIKPFSLSQDNKYPTQFYEVEDRMNVLSLGL